MLKVIYKFLDVLYILAFRQEFMVMAVNFETLGKALINSHIFHWGFLYLTFITTIPSYQNRGKFKTKSDFMLRPHQS